MSLLEFIRPMSKDELDEFSKRCETTAGQIKQVAYGNRRASAGLSIAIDRETNGAITCDELRPDIDWAYLRDKKPTKTEAA